MNQKTKKLITMRKTFHPSDDIGYMIQEKNSVEESPTLKRVWLHEYGDYIKKSNERLITAVSYSSDEI